MCKKAKINVNVNNKYKKVKVRINNVYKNKSQTDKETGDND